MKTAKIASAFIITIHTLNSCTKTTGRLPMPGCTNTYAYHFRTKAEHVNDPRSLRTKATFRWEVIHASMFMKLGKDQACSHILRPGI